jgi:phage minor structural protein
MKPILFPANATSFSTNGLGRLEPTKCTVIEERNGQYELSCIVPVSSPHYSDIRNNMIIAVSPSDGATIQAFRIYQITEPLNGLVTLSARHISYDLSYNSVMPFTADSCSAALLGLNSYAVETQPFTFWTDKSVVADFAVKVPQPIRSCLGGQRGSILDVYGGVYEWDNWTVKLWTRRGSDNGVTLRYGKNITDLSQEQNLESVVTGIVPFWANESTVVTLPEKSVDSAYASQYPYKRTVPVDFSSEWESTPTAAQLRTRAQSYVVANKIGIPKISLKVSFVALWQTEEYKTVAPLERVKLCDTVHIIFERYNIDAVAEVVRTEWDVLNERYLSIELGEARANLANTLVQMNEQTNQALAETTSELQGAIDRATNIITGQNGGWLKINSDSNNRPYELLIMDAPDETEATKLWRWNIGGLGYSKDGYEGPYGTAMTMNGEIVANFITAGEMSANRVRAGLLVSTAKQTGTQIPVTTFNLDTGKLSTVDGEFSGSIENTVVKSAQRTDTTKITGAKIESISNDTVTGTVQTTIEGGKITTDNIESTDADITSRYGNAKARLNDGKLIFLNNSQEAGTLSFESPYGQDAVYYDAKGLYFVITDTTKNGRLIIGDGLRGGSAETLQRVDIDAPLYLNRQVYAFSNYAGLGDYNGYQITLDGRTLTFRNGLLTDVT